MRRSSTHPPSTEPSTRSTHRSCPTPTVRPPGRGRLSPMHRRIAAALPCVVRRGRAGARFAGNAAEPGPADSRSPAGLIVLSRSATDSIAAADTTTTPALPTPRRKSSAMSSPLLHPDGCPRERRTCGLGSTVAAPAPPRPAPATVLPWLGRCRPPARRGPRSSRGYVAAPTTPRRQG